MVAEIAGEMRLSQETIDRRLAILGITSDDIALIKAQKTWYSKNIDKIAEGFGRRFELYRSDRASLDEAHDGEQIKHRVRDYFNELLRGVYDMAYVRRCLTVGVTHSVLNIEQEWYVAAYSWLLDELIRSVCSHPDGLNGKPEAIVSSLTKIIMFDMGIVLETYNHANHQAIENLAKHDALTGLPNHNLLIEEIKKLLKSCSASNPVYIFFIGLNRFKAVNETLGHGVGDKILKKVADRLKGMIPEGAFLSRLGGDIFVLGAGGNACCESSDALSREIVAALHEPVALDDFSVDVSATVGLAAAEDPNLDVQSLMVRAETAMYHAKSRQLTCTVFEIDMRRYSVTQLGIGGEIRNAMDRDELVLFYQPKIDVQTEQIVGVEALIRWMHPTKGFMSPGLFIPVIEETVLIHPVTEWVLKHAIKKAAEWQKNGRDLIVSANLSAANLQNLQLPGQVQSLLSENDLAPSRLMLEITESGLMADPQRARVTVTELKDLGVKLSIDDFGTGYSSLSYLKTLPVDEVKVDRIFVSSMCKDQKDARIVKATIGLGHSLGLEVSAEGAEDKETLDKLKFYDCDTVQGFFISKPLPADELDEWLKNTGA